MTERSLQHENEQLRIANADLVKEINKLNKEKVTLNKQLCEVVRMLSEITEYISMNKT